MYKSIPDGSTKQHNWEIINYLPAYLPPACCLPGLPPVCARGYSGWQVVESR